MDLKGVLRFIAMWWPSSLLVIQALGAAIGAKPDLSGTVVIVVIQLAWLGLWYGVPAGARRLGAVVGGATSDE